MTQKQRCISDVDGPCKRLALAGKNYCAQHVPKGRIGRGLSVTKAPPKRAAARRAARKTAG